MTNKSQMILFLFGQDEYHAVLIMSIMMSVGIFFTDAEQAAQLCYYPDTLMSFRHTHSTSDCLKHSNGSGMYS